MKIGSARLTGYFLMLSPREFQGTFGTGYGNFIHSNDASYDPNTQSNQHYELTKKK